MQWNMLHQTFEMHRKCNSNEEKHANCERDEARKQIKLQNASLQSNSQVFLTFYYFKMKNTTNGQRPEGTTGVCIQKIFPLKNDLSNNNP